MQNLTNFNGALKEVYEPTVHEQIVTRNILLSELQKNVGEKSMDGKSVRLFLHTGQNWAVGSISETGDFISAGNESLTQATVDMKWTYAHGKLTDAVIKATESSKSAAAKALATEMQGLKKQMTEVISRQFWGDGTGIMALANGAGASSTSLTVDTPTSGESNSTLFRKGMKIDVWTSGGSKEVDGVEIASVSGSVLTLATASTWSDNSYVTMHDGYNAGTSYEMMGIKAIVDDGTVGGYTTIEGINRTTAGNEFWQATMVNGGSAAISETLMQSAFSEALKNDAKQEDMIILTSWALMNKLGSVLAGDRRYNVEGKTQLKYEGGFTGVTFNGVPIVPDVFAVQNRVYFLDKSTLSIEELAPIGFVDENGQILTRVSGKPQYEFALKYYANLAVNNCAKNVCLYDVTT